MNEMKLKKQDALILSVILITNLLFFLFYFNIEYVNDVVVFMTQFSNGQTDFFMPTGHWFVYRPLVVGMYYVSYMFWSYNPIPIHVLVLLFNIGNQILVYIIAKKIIKNQNLASISVFLAIIANSLYFQVFSWSACLFYPAFVFFYLLGVNSYIDYKKDNKKSALMQFIIYLTIGMFCNEATFLVLPSFLLFDLLTNPKFKDFITKDIPKYLFLVPGILFVFYADSKVTKTDTWHIIYTIPLVICFAITLLVALPKLKKTNYNLKFLIVFSIFPLLLIFVKFTPRSAYLFFLISPMLLVYLFKKKNKISNIFLQIQLVFSLQYLRKKRNMLKISLVCSLVILSSTSFIYSCSLWYNTSVSYWTVSSQIDTTISTSETIYILNMPMWTDFFNLGTRGTEISNVLYLISNKWYRIQLIYVNITPYQFMDAYKITESDFNTLSTNGSVVYAIYPNFLTVNVSGKLFGEI